MKVLIYTEPQIEMDYPALKGNWLTDWIPRLVAGISEAYDSKVQIIAVGANHLVQEAPNIPKVEWIGIHQRDVVDLWHEDSLSGRLKRYSNQAGVDAKRHAARIASALNGFTPDCIIALSDAQFLKSAYPNAAILQHEFGLYSRPPFPQTFFFDPVGPSGVAWIGRYWSQVIERWNPTAAQLEVTRDFIEAYKAAIEKCNPFDDEIRHGREKFSRFCLLPLQMTGHSLYDSFTPVRSPLQLTLAALEVLPKDMGLFVTMHPGGNTLDEGAVQYLRSHYPSFLTPQNGGWHPAPSQYLVPACEGVVCVSSTVSALTLLWGNAFIAAGKGYLDFAAANRWTQPWQSRSALSVTQRERLIAWLLFHFLVVADDIRDGVRMRALINQAMKQHATKDYASFFESLPPQPVEIIRERWVEHIHKEADRSQFKHMLAQFCKGISCADDAKWGPLELKLDALLETQPASPERALFRFHKGIVAINWKRDADQAATNFLIARDEYADLCSKTPTDDLRNKYWDSAFHAPYALRFSNDRSAYERSLVQLLCEAPPAVGPLPQHIAQRLPELVS